MTLPSRAGVRSSWWRAAARCVPYLGAVALAGCTADVTGVGEGNVHGLVITGVSTVQLIEYSAPPFTETRRLTLNGGNSFVRPMLTATLPRPPSRFDPIVTS